MPKKGTRGDAYLIDSKFSNAELTKIAEALTNPILEKYFINESPQVGNFSYAIEIGFKPGVTDNVGHTVEEIAKDLLHLKKDSNFKVYTSKIFLIPGSHKLEDVRKMALTLYNPLIERAYVAPVKSGKINLPLKAPKVDLQKTKKFINLSL